MKNPALQSQWVCKAGFDFEKTYGRTTYSD